MTESHDSTSESHAWATVFSTNNSAEAYIVAGRLESGGFHPRVHQEPGGSALGITVGILGEVQVLVPEHELEGAQLLLDSDLGPSAEEADEEENDYEDDETE